ncbi:MAG: glycosyltransferase [Clostridia bacterium]|nr:glycosyltransferase [Clostridia bacterium]
MAKVSVIITAFNVEKYIVEAVNSVVAQTLEDIEILVIDDCSTDGTYALLCELEKLDARIRVVRHEQNQSVMIARKHGVEYANGEYLMFLDGDDMLTPDACETAYRAITEANVDLLQFDTRLFSDCKENVGVAVEENVRAYLQSVEHKRLSVSPCGLLDQKAVGGTVNFTLWNKIYKSEILKQATAEVPNEYMNIAEDVLLSYLVQYFSHSFLYIPKKIHRYRLGSGITTSASSRVSENKMRAVAKGFYTYTYLRAWTEARGTESLCRETLRRIRLQMFANVSSLLFHQLEPAQKLPFFTELEKYATKEDLLLMLHESQTVGEGLSAAALADTCAKLPLFQSEKTEIKTVGAYYFRVRNGGIENVLSVLTDLWVKQGYRVVLFTDEEPHRSDYEIHPAVTRVVLPPLEDGGDADDALERIRTFRAAMLKYQVDLMVYNAWVSPCLLLDEMIVKSCGARLLVHTHGMFCFDIANESSLMAYRNAALGHLYRLADAVVALTDVDVAWWRAQGLRALKTVNPIKLPLDVEPSPLTGHRILVIGRISPEKQILDALKITERVRKKIPDTTLTIVGKADLKEYSDEVHAYIKEQDMKSYVTLAGFHTNVLPFYQNADVLLSTSTAEGFGLVLMEGKLCGLPLVAYELPNLDITRENRGMVTVPQSDVDAAADAIVALFSDDASKHAMGADARASVQELYRIDFGALWDGIFREAVKPKNEDRTCKETPAELAIRIAADAYTEGIQLRSRGYAASDAVGLSGDWRYYEEQCKVLSKALKELANSESYRFGLFITAIPRAIHRWFQKLRKKK